MQLQILSLGAIGFEVAKIVPRESSELSDTEWSSLKHIHMGNTKWTQQVVAICLFIIYMYVSIIYFLGRHKLEREQGTQERLKGGKGAEK